VPPAEIPFDDGTAFLPEVYCSRSAGESGCPENVGSLIQNFSSSDAVQHCTATLIEPDLIITARHCLPEPSQLARFCRGDVRVVFPRSHGFPTQAIECKQVELAPDLIGGNVHERLRHPDFATLRLTHKLERKPAEVVLDGLPSDLTVNVVSARLSNRLSANDATLLSQDCRVMSGLPFFRDFEQSDSPVATIGECRFVPGDSGSPVFDEQGKLRAVLHGSVKTTSGKYYGYVTNLQGRW
jgi:hypothetical protein